jgi:hypothetical protein
LKNLVLKDNGMKIIESDSEQFLNLTNEESWEKEDEFDTAFSIFIYNYSMKSGTNPI